MLPYQSKMARAALGWNIRDAASYSGVAPNTISRFENGHDVLHSTVATLKQALERAGLAFDQDGVRFERVDWRNTKEGETPPLSAPVLIQHTIGPHQVQRATFSSSSRRWVLVDAGKELTEDEVPAWAPGPWPLDGRWLENLRR